MAAMVDQQVVKSPGTLVISAYAPCPDITRVVTPDLKCPGGKGVLLYVPFGSKYSSTRLGGSALAQCLSQIGDNAPDMDSPEMFSAAFGCTQDLIFKQFISAGHDISDGGLITCILEMAFAGNCSIYIDIKGDASLLSHMFAEELGIVVEVDECNVNAVSSRFSASGIQVHKVGVSMPEFGPDAKIEICFNQSLVLSGRVNSWRDIWEETSFELEKLQCDSYCSISERQILMSTVKVPWKLAFPYHDDTIQKESLVENGLTNGFVSNGDTTPSVAVLREEGSNGDREMAACFLRAGFRVFDVCMEDVISGLVNLNDFRGLAFVGGFSYADVLGSAKGWASSILFHSDVKRQFEKFYRRPDTFSLGVCNGCQLMAFLGWVGNLNKDDEFRQRVLLDENVSGRFESRFSSVKIEKSPAIMFKGMEGSVLGVWVSHGEGKFTYKDENVLSELESLNLVPLRYVTQEGDNTELYPWNPNGSVRGVAGVCSLDGRHLALMPHPERTFLTWQWPYWPRDILAEPRTDLCSPWMKMFTNAYDWCLSKF